MKQTILLLFVVLKIVTSVSAKTLIVSSTEIPEDSNHEVENTSPPQEPIIYEMDVHSNISNRFAKTLISSYVKNPTTRAQESTFTVVLPEKAFISEFILKIGGKEYKAYVKEKEEAKQIYNQAVQRGQTAGHVAVSARDSNKFTVSVNVEPESKAAFLLTYEELLERKNSKYELVLNIHPGQVVEKLHIEVYINESRPLKFARVPSIRSGNEIEKTNENLNPLADINTEGNSAVITYDPSVKKQKEIAKEFGKQESGGFSGQFVVEYDVEHDPNGGEVLLQDGYFVHFFAPDDLKPLPKHIVFVLDTSSSMTGRGKIDHLKTAMKDILGQLQPGDLFNIIEFNSYIYAWDIDTKHKKEINVINYREPFSQINMADIPRPSSVDDETIANAKGVINSIYVGGSTNIIGGLDLALATIKIHSDDHQEDSKNIQPIIMFLTDGQPVGGIGNTNEIVKIVTKINSENSNVPIYSLSFGEGADKEFLRKLSSKNNGFSRHIYEAGDASIQLYKFYQEISSPLLSNVRFKYTDVINATKTHFPIIYRGSETAICGYIDEKDMENYVIEIVGVGKKGPITLRPTVERSVSSLERLWAYLTIKQKLEERYNVDNKAELTKEALDLALKYSFVTDVTSLVVVKPNSTDRAEINDARPGAEALPRPSSMSSGYSFRTAHYQPVLPYAARSQPAGYYGAPGPRPTAFRTSSLSFHSGVYPSMHGQAASIQGPENRAIISNQYTTRPPWFTSMPTTPTMEDKLPWLSSVLNPNRTITINQENYDLGDHYNPSLPAQCPKTPTNVVGRCTLLRFCPQVYSQLDSFATYQQYFCIVDNVYAGVCCPVPLHPTP